MRLFRAGALFFLFATAAPGAARADALEAGARAYAAENFVRAEQLIRPRAERGDPRAGTYLGVMYLRGRGVPQAYEIAAFWLRRAADAGEPAAEYFLGLLYDRGLGVAQSSVIAEAWISLAVAHAPASQRAHWVVIRDAIAAKLSRSDLEAAQWLAFDRGY